MRKIHMLLVAVAVVIVLSTLAIGTVALTSDHIIPDSVYLIGPDPGGGQGGGGG